MGELISSNSKILGKGFQIVGVFDKDSKKIGTQIETLGITIKDMDDLKEEARKLKIDAVILAVTKEHAQIVADRIIMSGIHAILNMTTYKLEVPKGVAVMNIDISAKLQELNYWRKQVKFDKK
jgi:redox-sensing transcriptional repressor